MNTLEQELAPLKLQLIQHPIYRKMQTIEDIRLFMEKHIFAVWDFMSLVKKLQAELTCIALPWTPPKHPTAARLINEIVVGEETDANKDGVVMSHFEMYLQAMEDVGADTSGIKLFIENPYSSIIEGRVTASAALTDYLKDFLNFTFTTIAENKTHVIAAVFTFGREDLIPDMFIEMVKNLRNEGNELEHLIYYLDRHIEVDGDEHGPMALKMIEALCEDDTSKIEEATVAAQAALQMRLKLWDGILSELPSATTT